MDQLNNQDLERNFRDREQTRTALARKLETLETRMRDNVEQVKESVRRSTDLRYHVDNRPWTMLGLSVVVGVVAARLLIPERRSFVGRSRYEVEDLLRRGSDSTRKSLQALAENIDLDQYAQHWGVIKKAALGVLASVAGQFARQVVPSILSQIDNFAKEKNLSDSTDRVQEASDRFNDRIRTSSIQ